MGGSEEIQELQGIGDDRLAKLVVTDPKVIAGGWDGAVMRYFERDEDGDEELVFMEFMLRSPRELLEFGGFVKKPKDFDDPRPAKRQRVKTRKLAGVAIDATPVVFVQAGPDGTWIEPPEAIARAYAEARLLDVSAEDGSVPLARATHNTVAYEVFYDATERDEGYWLYVADGQGIDARPVPFWEAPMPRRTRGGIDLRTQLPRFQGGPGRPRVIERVLGDHRGI